MSVATLNEHTVAVCIAQPSLRLVLPDASIWEAASTPLLLATTSTPAPTVLGFFGQHPPQYSGFTRALTTEELSAEAIFVPLITDYIHLLRAAGFHGQILTPGVVRPTDGKMAAHHSTVTVLTDAL